MMFNNRLLEYEGKTSNDFELIPDISFYNHNYYKGLDNDILYAESDDDDATDWYLCDPNNYQNKKAFGWSYTSEGNVIVVNKLYRYY